MDVAVASWSEAGLDAVRAVLEHPSNAAELDQLQGPGGLESTLEDPFIHPRLRWLAMAGGEPAAASFTWALPSWDGDWALVRIAVVDHWRRRGLGSELLGRTLARLRVEAPAVGEACLAALEPNPAAESFAAARGFQRVRTTWLMERPAGPAPEPEWPAGIETRGFDGSERALADWTGVYNRSFRHHYHGVRATVEDCRRIMARPRADAGGLLLAYRDGACVGFCRCERHAGRGEVALLGVDPDCRRLGLGRALLRWGVAWIAAGQERVTLGVDGGNESAIDLYRAEGFVVARQRALWARRDF